MYEFQYMNRISSILSERNHSKQALLRGIVISTALLFSLLLPVSGLHAAGQYQGIHGQQAQMSPATSSSLFLNGPQQTQPNQSNQPYNNGSVYLNPNTGGYPQQQVQQYPSAMNAPLQGPPNGYPMMPPMQQQMAQQQAPQQQMLPYGYPAQAAYGQYGSAMQAQPFQPAGLTSPGYQQQPQIQAGYYDPQRAMRMAQRNAGLGTALPYRNNYPNGFIAGNPRANDPLPPEAQHPTMVNNVLNFKPVDYDPNKPVDPAVTPKETWFKRFGFGKPL